MTQRPRLALLCLLAIFFGAAFSRPAWAAPSGAATAKEQTPEQVLAAKGLVRFGSYFVLEPDAKLGEWLRVTRAAEAKARGAANRRANLERDVRAAEEALANLDEMDRRQTDILDHMKKSVVFSYNQQVDRVNAIRQRWRDASLFLDTRQRALADLQDPADEYVSAVLKLSDVTEAAAKRYEQLAADPEVAAAINQVNARGKGTFKLGPSARFAEELPKTRKLRDSVNSESIRFEILGGVPHVKVLLNGTVETLMVVDSGAADVSLSPEVAEKLGLHPKPSDPTVKMVTADGTVASVPVMHLKSVRLGKFTVEDVECLVLPPSNKGADCLLGGTFFRHFIYRMDLNTGVLRISELTGDMAKAAAGADGKTASGSDKAKGGAGAKSSATANDFPQPPAAPKPDRPDTGQIRILSARWGGGSHWADVSDRVVSLLKAGQPFAVDTKSLGADPTPGWHKHLEIEYQIGTQRKSLHVDEGKKLEPYDFVEKS
jgi:clan AA aspartic protease (TIGR02281 family)